MKNQFDHKHLSVRDRQDLDLLEEAVAAVTDAEYFHEEDCPRLADRQIESVDQRRVAENQLWPCPDCHDQEWVLIAGAESLGGRERVYHTRACTSAPLDSPRTAKWVPQDELRDDRRECKRCISEPHGQPHPEIPCPLCGQEPIKRLPDHLPDCQER